MGELTNVPYSETYIEECFTAWYSNRCPDITKFVASDKFPKDEHGRQPPRGIVYKWVEERGWFERRDVIDAKAINKIEDELVSLQVNTLRRQAAQAGEIRNRAFEHILENGFDSSASAVSAFKMATETERITLGMSKTLQRLSEMDDDEVMQTVKELAERAGATIVDVAPIEQEEDAEPLD